MKSDLKQTDIILITGPALGSRGGVANFYSHVLPALRTNMRQQYDIEYLPIGSAPNRNRILGPIEDQRRMSARLTRDGTIKLVHVNPSLTLKCAIRDGLFVWQAKRRRLPVVVFFRGWNQEFEKHVSHMLLPYFERTFFRADSIIVLGEIFEEKIRSWGFKGSIYRTTTVVNPDIMRMKGMDKSAKNDEISLLFLSRLELAKGILDILEALEILRKKGVIANLTIAGDGVARRNVEDWMMSHPAVASHVKLTGFVRGRKKIELFANHDIFVLPTVREGLPNSLLEAMAAGMPVITCDAGAIKEIVIENQNGFYVQPHSPSEIADLVEMIGKNRALIREISERNKRIAEEKFSVQSVSSRLSEVYRLTLADCSHNS